ncbi:MAG: hypothetical protein RIE73_28960 [Coleofasciculus sp. C1-SOL-03]
MLRLYIASPASLPYCHPPSHYLWVSVKYASVIIAPLVTYERTSAAD